MRTMLELVAVDVPKPGAVIAISDSFSGIVSVSSTILLLNASIFSNEVPSGAVAEMRSLLLSSIGANSSGILKNNTTIATREAIITIKETQRTFMKRFNVDSYPLISPIKKRSVTSNNLLWLLLCFNILELIIGVSVNETTPEMATAAATTTPNSRNNLPCNPSINTIGMNTAQRVM